MSWTQFLPLSYEQVGHLSYNLATCLAAGVELPRAFRTSTQSLAKTDSEAWGAVGDGLEHGESLSDALKRIEPRLPPFYLPLIAAGEHTGRLAEVLQYLADHCKLLARPRNALRNVWLMPLSVYLVGIPLKFVLLALFGVWSHLGSLLVDSIAQLGSLAAIAVLVLAPPLKPIWDRVRIIIPVIGRAERDLSVSRFLRVFAMLYATGGMRVEKMIRFAAGAVTNDYFRRDLLRPAKPIERGTTIAQAFAACTSLNHDEQGSIATGELAGKLESVCERLSAGLDEGLEARMKVVTAVAIRITMGLVSLSLGLLAINLLSAVAMHKLM